MNIYFLEINKASRRKGQFKTGTWSVVKPRNLIRLMNLDGKAKRENQSKIYWLKW